MSERDELIAYLRVCSACYGCGIGADGDTCTNCDDRRQPNRRAADLLERDGAEIARLREEVSRWHQVWDNVQLDVPELRDDNKPLAVAASYELTKRERDEARTALAEAQRDTDRINWLESHARRVDVRVKKSGNRLWVVNPPACTEYELSKSLREAIDVAIEKEQSHASK